MSDMVRHIYLDFLLEQWIILPDGHYTFIMDSHRVEGDGYRLYQISVLPDEPFLLKYATAIKRK